MDKLIYSKTHEMIFGLYDIQEAHPWDDGRGNYYIIIRRIGDKYGNAYQYPNQESRDEDFEKMKAKIDK